MLQLEALSRRRVVWSELLRLLILVAGATLADFAFLTTRQVGGVDARWYAYMQRGFTDQFGSGHMPLLIGQGPFAWNGGVHPFRSAPVFILVGGFWKVATLGRAGMFAIEHLTAITSTLVGIWGFYRLGCLLLPDRRWLAMASALVYAFLPSWLATVYLSDAYMSYMAFAAMPLVLYGNARTLLGQNGRGYVPLAAGVALIWMCHPPIALLTTVTSIFIQSIVLCRDGLRFWRQILFAAVIFGCLAAYYFGTMGEVPKQTNETDPHHAVFWLLGMALLTVGAGRTLFFRFGWVWAVTALGGLALIGAGSHPWLVWALYALGFSLLGSLLLRLLRVPDRSAWAVPILVLATLGAAAAAAATLPTGYPPPNAGIVAALHNNTKALGQSLRPLPEAMNFDWAFQLGWAGDAALMMGLLALCTRRSLAEQVFGAAALMLLCCVLDVPGVSEFLVGRYPEPFAFICGVPLTLRVAPVLASFSLMAGVLWLAATLRSRKVNAWGWAAFLAMVVGWGAFQATRFVRYGQWQTLPMNVTQQMLRSENIMLDRYAYDLLWLPDYYSNGIVDPALESRLLDPAGTILIGPQEMARDAEAHGARIISLTTQAIPNSDRWLGVSPKIDVAPGERLLLDFKFDPQKNYQAYMIMAAEGAYREYHLPDSGRPLAFGVGGRRISVLALWNSGSATSHYHIELSRENGNNLKSNGDLFAELTISRLDPAVLPIRLLSLDPYHAVVKAPTAGFLETFRVMLPGYRAFVDGVEVVPESSRQQLVEVPVPAGVHDVVVQFVGSRRMWLTALLSGLAWLALPVVWARRPCVP